MNYDAMPRPEFIVYRLLSGLRRITEADVSEQHFPAEDVLRLFFRVGNREKELHLSWRLLSAAMRADPGPMPAGVPCDDAAIARWIDRRLSVVDAALTPVVELLSANIKEFQVCG